LLDEEMISAFAGELLPDWYEDWLIAARERWREIRVRTLELIAHRQTDTRNWMAALEAARAAVLIEPLRETSRRVLIGVYRAEGNHGQAVKEFESFRALLGRELEIEPSSALRALAYGGVPNDRFSPGGITSDAAPAIPATS
jgi:two-component SAPR family response regulator